MRNVYSEKVMEHFANPRNAGRISDAHGVGAVGDPLCGDFLRIYIKVEDNRISHIKFEITGCPAAIAAGSVLTGLAKGKTLDDAFEIMDGDILEALGGLPEHKLHCTDLGTGALQEAILNYIIRSVG